MNDREIYRSLGEMQKILQMTTGEYQRYIEGRSGEKVTKGSCFYHKAFTVEKMLGEMMAKIKEGMKR